MTTTIRSIQHALEQASTVMLATAEGDLGLVPATTAAAEAVAAAMEAGEQVSIRNVVTDEVIAIATPGGHLLPAPRASRPVKRMPADKRNLTELLIRRIKPRATNFVIWDKQKGLGLRVMPTGSRSFKFVYSRRGRPRWLHLGDVSIGLAAARQMAAEAMLSVAKGGDPAAEKRSQRGEGTFAELHKRYVDEHAKKHNRSWHQGDLLIRRLLPRWGVLQATSITRADVRSMMTKIASPTSANQTLAALSAVFSWAAKQDLVVVNPCRGVDRNRTVSRERVLSDSEMPLFWKAFGEVGGSTGNALKVILLTGQRPGEVSHLRYEHIKDGWWEMPGEPVPELWPGTKNSQAHRVWLSQPVQALIGEGAAGFAFPGPRGLAVSKLDLACRAICKAVGAERCHASRLATDLRHHGHVEGPGTRDHGPHPEPQKERERHRHLR